MGYVPPPPPPDPRINPVYYGAGGGSANESSLFGCLMVGVVLFVLLGVICMQLGLNAWIVVGAGVFLLSFCVGITIMMTLRNRGRIRGNSAYWRHQEKLKNWGEPYVTPDGIEMSAPVPTPADKPGYMEVWR